MFIIQISTKRDLNSILVDCVLIFLPFVFLQLLQPRYALNIDLRASEVIDGLLSSLQQFVLGVLMQSENLHCKHTRSNSLLVWTDFILHFVYVKFSEFILYFENISVLFLFIVYI